MRYNIGTKAKISLGAMITLAILPLAVLATSSDYYRAEFFNNRSLTGDPVLVRQDPVIDFNWGTGSPGPGVNADYFSARWTKTTHFEEGTYEFSVTADDGVRLYIDSELVIDKWFDQGPTIYTYVKSLSRGEHSIKMEYFEHWVGATAKLAITALDVTTSPPPEDDPDTFSIIVLPDTQKYIQFHPHIFTVQTEWIRDNYASLNAKFVLHEGDIVETPGLLSEWANANTSMSVLDGHIPYVFTVGNHDFPTNDARDTTNFNNTFPVSRYSSEPWFGGVFEPGKLDNAYFYLEAGGLQFLILSLEFGPRDEVLTWANQIATAHPDHKIILLTHTYLYEDNTLHGSDPSHEYPPELWLTYSNNGVGIWEKFVRRNSNILFTFNGHVNEVTGVGRLVSVGDAGNRVYQMLADYQDYPNGGNGWLRIVTINPAELTAAVKTYSPYLNSYLTDDANQFTYTNVTELFEVFAPAPDPEPEPDPAPINQPPVVSAGADQTITLPTDNVNLSGVITDDGLPEGAVSTSMWTRISGPGTIAFADDSLAETEAAFSEAGEYVLRLTADDGEYIAYDEVKITVLAEPAISDVYFAEFFNNRSLTGDPVLTREDPVIDFNWGTGSPGPGVNSDKFSARWSKISHFAAGDYEFSVTADDGVRLYIDGQLVIDKWMDQGPTTYTVQKTLSEGPHTVKMEYYENMVGATAKLAVAALNPPEPPAGDEPAPAPAAVPSPVYFAEFFNNRSLTGDPVLTRLDPVIDFNWGTGSPGPGVNADYFSARWTAEADFLEGSYTFSVTADDGVRLYIDGQLVIDKWMDQGPTTYTVQKTLTAGVHALKMEYYEHWVGAVAKLKIE